MAPKKELDQLVEQLNAHEEQVKNLTLDRMHQAPLLEHEPQTHLSSKELEKSKDIYLKPERSISSREKFNEKYREDFNFSKEYVQFIAENKEIIGETIEIWTKPFAGLPAEFWKVPTNKPIWGPRYLAEQIRRKTYHRLSMKDAVTGEGEYGTRFFGQMVADNTIARLTAEPVSSKKSIFMGRAA